MSAVKKSSGQVVLEQVMTMLAKEEDPRNHALLRLLYNAGLRVSELCSLTWRDVQPNATTGGQVTVCGKGDKVRSIPISAETYAEVQAFANRYRYCIAITITNRNTHSMKGNT